MQSIGALKNAVLVLSKHNAAFLQHHKGASAFLQSASAEQSVKTAVTSVLSGKHQSPSLNKLKTLLAQQPANAGSYVPASGQIFGILKQMKEEFESNLSQAQKDEMQAVEEFEALREAKRREIEAGKAKSKELTFQKADTDDALAQAKEDLGMTREAISADTAFLMDLRLRCQQSDKDWSIRQKTRAEEIAAVSEAIGILSDDDAFDLFDKTVNSFVQLKQLMALASKVQLDAFVKVKKAIDDMTAALKAEQE